LSHVGDILGRINEVTWRWAGLVPGWVTVCRYTIPVLACNHATQVNSAWPSLHGWAHWVSPKAGT